MQTLRSNRTLDFCPALTKLALDLHVKKCVFVCESVNFAVIEMLMHQTSTGSVQTLRSNRTLDFFYLILFGAGGGSNLPYQIYIVFHISDQR